MWQTICPITNKMGQYKLNSKAMSYSHCFGTPLTLNKVAISMCFLSKVPSSFLVVLEVS